MPICPWQTFHTMSGSVMFHGVAWYADRVAVFPLPCWHERVPAAVTADK